MAATVLIRVALLVALVPARAWASEPDACRASLPGALIARLEAGNTGFRVPRVTDNLPDDVGFHRAAGGNGCVGIASSDFNGDGHSDFVVALSGRESPAGRVVVALRARNGWQLHRLVDWASGRQRLYVDTVGADVYRRFEELEVPISGADHRRGERDTMTCRHSGVMLGATEASGVVYCHLGGAWQYVWVSD